MSDLRSFWTNLLDPYGRNRGPAENPQRRSYADFAATGQYAAPTYAEDIATARTPRAPLSSVPISATSRGVSKVLTFGAPCEAGTESYHR